MKLFNKTLIADIIHDTYDGVPKNYSWVIERHSKDLLFFIRSNKCFKTKELAVSNLVKFANLNSLKIKWVYQED